MKKHEEKCDISEDVRGFVFIRKIFDGFQGLSLLLKLFSTKSSTISLMFSESVSLKKTNNQFWGLTVFDEK